jgi:hypothetical protein
MYLKAEINWHRLFQDLIGEFDAEALARRQASALEAAGLWATAISRRSFRFPRFR